MKTLLTILALFLCLTLQAQNCYYHTKEPYKPTPFEDYVTGAGFITTFYIVNQTEISKRPGTATVCMVTNVGVNLAVKGIRKVIKRKRR